MMSKKTPLSFFLVLLFLAGCSRLVKKEPAPSPAEEAKARMMLAENYVGDGIDFYKSEKYGQAVKKWNRALEIIPRDAEVYNFVGLAYHKKGDLDSAIIAFKKAVRLDSGYYQAWNNLGFMNFLKSNYKTALKYFDRSLEANPQYVQAALNRQKTMDILTGDLKLKVFELVEKTSKMDSLQLQIHNYRKALALDSNYVDAWNNLGVAYYYYGNIDSAVYCLKRALDINPEYPPAHNNVAYMLDAMGEYDKAIAHYQKAIQLRPFYVTALANLVDSYVHKKDYDSARKILDALQTGSPNHSLVRQRVEEYQEILYGNSQQGGN